MSDKYDLMIRRAKIEEDQKWHEDMQQIPFIKFNPDWCVQVTPPFGDAVVRFRVKLPSGLEKSIYLDSRSSLGYYCDGNNKPVPYWEVYPYCGDVGRCLVSDIESLLEMIADESEGD
jgi:hypothetical protein